MDDLDAGTLETEIIRLEVLIDNLQRYGDHAEASRTYRLQQELYRKLPGGDEPAIGEAGRTL